MSSSGTAVAGWYPDPSTPGQLRYWDGQGWTANTVPDPAEPAGPAGGAERPADATTPLPIEQPGYSPAGPAGSFSQPGSVGSFDQPGGGLSQPGSGSYGQPGGAFSQPGSSSYAQPGGGFSQPGGGYAQPGAGGYQPAGAGGYQPAGAGAYQPGGGGAVWTPAGPAGYGVAGPGLGDVGSWLGDTFRTLFSRIIPVSVLLFAVPAVGFAASAWVAVGGVSGLTYDKRSSRLYGADTGQLLLALLILGLTLVAGAVCYLGANHQLYWAHAGRPASLGRSVAVGLKRLPRAIVWGIAFSLVVGLIVAVLYAAPVVLFAATDRAGFLALYLLTLPILLVLALWLGVRLAFLWPGVVLSPGGTNPWSTSWGLTRGRFWGVLGRILLLVLIAVVIGAVLQFALNIAFQAGLATLIKVDPATDDLIINGVDVNRQTVVAIGDLLPSRAALAVGFGLYSVVQSLNQAVILSGVTGLYRRVDGPAAA